MSLAYRFLKWDFPMGACRDFTLVAGYDGILVAHRIDCPQARALVDAGQPALTMLDCAKSLPDTLKKHTCLTHEQD